MAIKIQSNFVVEDIINENGEKIGKIKFNPNDSKIIGKLAKIMNDLKKAMDEINNIGEISDIPKTKLDSISDFEELSKSLEKVTNAISIEENVIGSVIEDFSEVFGKETVELFTNGTYDITSIMPLIEFITPYIEKARKSKVDKYLTKGSNDVMK